MFWACTFARRERVRENQHSRVTWVSLRMNHGKAQHCRRFGNCYLQLESHSVMSFMKSDLYFAKAWERNSLFLSSFFFCTVYTNINVNTKERRNLNKITYFGKLYVFNCKCMFTCRFYLTVVWLSLEGFNSVDSRSHVEVREIPDRAALRNRHRHGFVVSSNHISCSSSWVRWDRCSYFADLILRHARDLILLVRLVYGPKDKTL